MMKILNTSAVFLKALHGNYTRNVREGCAVYLDSGSQVCLWGPGRVPYGIAYQINNHGIEVITTTVSFDTDNFSSKESYLKGDFLSFCCLQEKWLPHFATASMHSFASYKLAKVIEGPTALSPFLQLEYHPAYYGSTGVETSVEPCPPTKPVAYGCTCTVCKEYYEYAEYREQFVCYSCKSYRSMFD